MGGKKKRRGGAGILRKRDIDVSVFVGSVFEQVSVEASLFHGLCVQSVGFFPIFPSREIFANQVTEHRLLSLLRRELIEKNPSKEYDNGSNRSLLYGRTIEKKSIFLFHTFFFFCFLGIRLQVVCFALRTPKDSLTSAALWWP